MRRLIPTLIGLIIVSQMLLSSCGGSFDRTRDERSTESPRRKPGVFDPLGMTQDKQIVPERYPLAPPPDTTIENDTVYVLSGTDSVIYQANMYETYRIQLFTSKTYGAAAKESKIAEEIFDRKVYLDYEVPYYKVRWGDFANSDEAEKYQPVAIEAGYKNAWVVRIPLNARNLKDIYDDTIIPPLLEVSDSTASSQKQPTDESEYPEN